MFSTLTSQLDAYHPVGGNRAFGIYNSVANPNSYTFYIMGVDRTWDWMDGLLNNLPPALGGNIIFNGADNLWADIQQKFISFVNSQPGGQASYFLQQKIIARPQWNDVKDYLQGIITWEQLKTKLGC